MRSTQPLPSPELLTRNEKNEMHRFPKIGENNMNFDLMKDVGTSVSIAPSVATIRPTKST
jgi:hypothetical protein